jgi:hypothetical protein
MLLSRHIGRWSLAALAVLISAGSAAAGANEGYLCTYDVKLELVAGQKSDQESQDKQTGVSEPAQESQDRQASVSGRVQVLDLYERGTRTIVLIPSKLSDEGPEVLRVLTVDDSGALQLDLDFASLPAWHTALCESALFTLVADEEAGNDPPALVSTSVGGLIARVKASLNISKDEGGRKVIELGHPDEQVVDSSDGKLSISGFSQHFVMDESVPLPAASRVAYSFNSPEREEAVSVVVTATRTDAATLDRKKLVMTRRDLKTLATIASRCAQSAEPSGDEEADAGDRYKEAKRWQSSVRMATKTLEKFSAENRASALAQVVPAMTEYVKGQMYVANDAVAETEFAAKMKGKPAPDFELDLLGGGRVRLSDHARGKVTLLSYWAVG